MFKPANKLALKWIIVTLALTLTVGCSPSSTQSPPSQTDSTSPTTPPSETTPPSSPEPPPDTDRELLLNMRKLAEQGKVINSDFPAKTTVIEDVKKKWGEPDKTEWVATAKGSYATYAMHEMVFGFNKGSQIFDVRSFDKQLKSLSLNKTKEVYGTPVYDVKVNGEEIIGYAAGAEFKIEFVFPEPTNTNSNPTMDHYLVLYPRGTVNNMADDPGRQW
ncbi:YjgB family protein [Desulfosporosinus fructosivorans]